MAIKSSKKSFGNNRTINYIGKDFASFRRNLIEFTKSYFPDTYSDFNEASPGMVFIEMASYIGDVLAYYQDAQLKESMLQHATEKKNIIALAQSMGYKPKVITPAVTNLTIYQLLPATGTGANNSPDSQYFLKIKPGLQVSATTDSNIIFRTTDTIDFSIDVDREITVYSRNQITGEPEFYLITKKAKAISAKEIEKIVSIPSSQTEYPSINLSEKNIIEITSITEVGSNDKWYEVPYLGQETVFIEYPNNNFNGKLSEYNNVPYILELKKVPKRFSYKVNTDNSFEIEFGAGDVNINDEIILPNPKNVGLGLTNSIKRLNTDLDPSNFLKSNTFGVAPAGKTLSIKYLIGGGVSSNVNVGDLVTISNIEYEEDLLSISNLGLYQATKDSVAVENLEPAIGGRGGESVEEIRQNALATFGSQNRAVTRQDYAIRALNMPARYGSIAKVYVAADSENDSETAGSFLSNPKNAVEFTNFVNRIVEVENQKERDDEIKKFISQKRMPGIQNNNPFAINMYLLGYDINGKLTNVNPAVKQNLKTYLSEYRMLTDVVNLVDGFIVNIGVEFDIVVYSNYNKSEVLANCLSEIKSFFNIENWSFNKPINLSEVELILANVEGVMSVPKVIVNNLFSEEAGYAPYAYNINNATVGKIIYPSLDPCVFEVKYPNKDIKGRAL